MKKFLSIILAILMVVTMLPMAVLPASAATEAAEVTADAFITYSSGVTQYVKHNNYLYKVAYTNLKIESVDIDISYEDLRIYRTTSLYCALLLAYQGSNAKSSNLPTSPGKSVSFYTADTYASNEKKPVVTVTCMAVSEPVWSWNGVSSATAVFTSTDGGAIMTVDAAIENSEKTAENCLETDTTAYTATATANGKEYTNVKTIYGEQGPHNFEYIESGDYMIGSCTNGCGMNCTHNWTDKNDYLCDNCGFECHHESYIDGICTVCGLECAHENITDGKCDDCGEDGIVVTITMTDSYSDGWNGNGIVVKQLVDGAYTEVATATFEDGASETFTALLRQDGIYAFSWVYGEYPEECSFTLTVDGETVYECADGGTLADSEIFYIICKHTSYTDGKCDVCDYECPHENQTGSVCEICGEHICSYNNGFCTECDAYQPATLVTNENYESFYLKADYVGYYAISNAGQLFWYANYINTVDRTANAVITEDIDLENRPWTPIGSTGEDSHNFRGIFNGQHYTIKGLYVEGGRAGLGFFGEVRTGTVKNFTIFGEVVVNTEVDYVGGVIGSICGVNGETDLERNGAIIQNINSYVDITVKAHGVGKIGGFVGYANHQSLIEQCAWYGTFDAGEYRVDNGAGGFIGRIQENTSEVTIRNCGAYGTIKTNYAGDYNDTATIYMGGFLSFSNTNAQTVLENCLFAGRFERGENLTDQAFLGAFGTLRSVKAIKNCYYLGDDGLEVVHSDSPLKPGSDNVEITSVTGEDLRGEMRVVWHMLGEYWTQGIHYPILKEGQTWHGDSATYTYTDNGDGTHKKTCNECGYVEEVNEEHYVDPTTTYTDNGNGTHSFKCAKCDADVAKGPHTLDVTTGKCSACGADMTVIATVTDGTNTYYAADAATLNQAVTAILETGSRTFTVELPADTEAEMITAIRRAICDTDGVADGSIHLTLGGVTSIPSTTNWDGVAFGPGDIYDEAGEIVDQELVTQLVSVNLPDATEIGAQAFYFCENLVAVSAPKAQTIGAQAFGYTALTSVEFPELTTIPTDMFSGTWTLSSAKFPKVTTIEQGGLLVGAKFNPENNPTPFPLELTAEGDITFIGSNHFNIASQNYSGKVDLVLCCDKADKVTKNEDGTATWQVRDDLSYTFKSITFKHSYTDGVCDNCGYECPHENVTGATCITSVECDVCGLEVYDLTNHEGEYVTVCFNDYQHVSEYECCHIESSVVYEDHKYENYTVITPADCVSNAWEMGECICGDIHIREIAGSAKNHDWSNLDGVCANGCGAVCPHEKYTDGVCDKCGYECAHEWGEGVLTRPTFETAGYYTYTCTLCGHSYTEPTKRADDTALNDASMKVMEYIGNSTLTQKAANEIHNSYLDILKNYGNVFDEFGFVRGDLVEEDQPAIDAITAELEKIIADADEKIASGEYVKADYTEIDEAIASVDEALKNATISDEMSAELEDIKADLEDLKENEGATMADVNELLERAETVAEKINNCAKGVHSFTKYEEVTAPECGKAGLEKAVCDHGCGATDEREIPALTHAPLEAVKENEVAPKCGVAGSYDLVVYCDLCGEELDRDTVTVDALTHTDEDGDYLCDHGCGHEFEKPVEPEQPDTPDTPDEPTDDTCDHICHSNNALIKFLWKIICFFYRLFNIQQYCDCGVIHYDAPVFG